MSGGEQIHRLCDCDPCRKAMPKNPVPSPHAPGGFCSEDCAKHAGGERRLAEADHAQEG